MSKVITRSEHFVEIDEVEYKVRLKPERGADIEHRKLDDGRMVIGYLMHDDDCSNPLEDCDAMGSIHSFGRHHKRTKGPDEFNSNIPYHIPLSYFEHGQCRWGVAGSMSSMPDFQWDGTLFAGFWEADKECILNIKLKAAEKFGVKVEVVQTCCVAMSKKDSKPWVLALKYKDKELWRGDNWDKMAVDAIRIAKKIGDVRNELFCAAADMASGICDTYTSWCNGECYGVIVVTCEADGAMIDSDECWGYIGREYAEKTMKEQMEAVK